MTVAAVAEREGRFLLVEERIRGHLVLNQPAGHLEEGESLLHAVVRETLEETGWQFEPQWLLGVYLWRGRHRHTTLRFAFIGAVDHFEPGRALDPPIIATHWLTREAVAAQSERLRTPLVLRCIDDYLGGRRSPLATIAGAQALDP